MRADSKEFLDLIDSNQGILHNICRVYTNNAIDHEDLFQEMLTQLWKGYGNYRGDAKLSTWIYRVSLYTAISYIKKLMRQRNTLNEIESTGYELPKFEESNEELLHRSIEHLSETDRAFILLYLEDKSYKEMAEILGITESNVGARLNRIKKKLKNVMV